MILYYWHINSLLLTVFLRFLEYRKVKKKKNNQYLGKPPRRNISWDSLYHFIFIMFWTVVLENKSLFWTARTHLNEAVLEVLAHSHPSLLYWNWLWYQGDSGLEKRDPQERGRSCWSWAHSIIPNMNVKDNLVCFWQTHHFYDSKLKLFRMKYPWNVHIIKKNSTAQIFTSLKFHSVCN